MNEQQTLNNVSIREIEWGVLDDVPIVELVQFLQKHGCTLRMCANGMAIVRQKEEDVCTPEV
jgi:hypothetical protein